MLPARLSAAPQPAAAPSESTTPAATSLIAQVVFDVPLDRHFDYQTTVPLAVGQRVRAGFAGRQLTGLVVGMADSSPYVVRPLDGTVDDLPPLPADWLALVHFASRYYHYPLGQTVFTALPAGLRGAKPFALPQDLGYQLTAKDSPYANIIVVKKGNENKDSIKALNEVINSNEIKTFIKEKYQGSIIEAF